MFDEEPLNQKYQKPLDLETLSVTELQERISNLQDEIKRCELAISKKKSSLNAANALFGNL
jgi:uncharacterized small protein (DUF1192 family)